MTEHEMYIQIADYMRYQYPEVIYRFDLAADLKLSIGQAKKHKRLQGRRGYPDLFIAEVRSLGDRYYHGLFIELKKAGTRIYRKDGRLVSDAHIREQFDMLEQLRQRGYKAEFAVGFDEAKEIIDKYLGGPEAEKVEF